MNGSYRVRNLVGEIALWLVALAFLLPVYLLVSISLKSPAEITSSPLGLPLHPHLSNYSTVWRTGAGGSSLGASFVNSVVISIATLVILIIGGSLAGYALGRWTSRWSTLFFGFFLAGIVIPLQLGIVPLYSLIRNLGLLGTKIGLIIVYSGILLPMAVLLFTGFVRVMPVMYEEAAYLDGASRIRTFFRVVLPMLRPVTATVVIITVLGVWNDFFMPLVFVGQSSQQTLPLAIYSFAGQYSSQWNLIFAGIVISAIPIVVLFLAMQRHVVRALAPMAK